MKTLSGNLKTVRQCNVKYSIRILEQELRATAVAEAKNKVYKTTSDTTSSWESEKLELQKSSDEALACAAAADEFIKKLSHEDKIPRESNDEYQVRTLDFQTIRDSMKLEHAAAVEDVKRKASAVSDATRSCSPKSLNSKGRGTRQ